MRLTTLHFTIKHELSIITFKNDPEWKNKIKTPSDQDFLSVFCHFGPFELFEVILSNF